jgi:DNA-binding response OmpR family regulator
MIFDRPHRRCIRHPEAGEIFLTEKEMAILDFLIEKAPQKLTKETILEAVWGYLPNTSLNTHTLETHIYHLRQKFEGHGLSSIILSDHEGYVFNGIQNQRQS